MFPAPLLVTARSSLPSALKSAAIGDVGSGPAGKLVGAESAPLPSFKRTLIVLGLKLKLVTATSALPSLLKSPTTTESGLTPALNVGAPKNVPSPRPTRIERLWLTLFAVTRSVFPSPLKSPETRGHGPRPTLVPLLLVNCPVPSPRNTTTFPEAYIATARSAF